jgi:hypothetical protein
MAEACGQRHKFNMLVSVTPGENSAAEIQIAGINVAG